MLSLTKAILNSDLPVSPKDFQNSVLNAAPAYLSIFAKHHAPAYSFSGGFASADRGLHFAIECIESGVYDHVLLAHCFQMTTSASGPAYAELVLLSSQFALNESPGVLSSRLAGFPGFPIFSLAEHSWQCQEKPDFAKSKDECLLQIESQDCKIQGHNSAVLLQGESIAAYPAKVRQTVTASGEVFYSRWEKATTSGALHNE